MLNCNYCDKKGLLIYPVRYAVASPYGAAGVPGLSGNFRIENGPQQIGEARYTLRALRAGYLYTYDERRGWFKAYVVMPTGHLWNFPLHYRPPHPSRIPFSCVEPGEIVRAYCLDIAHTPQDPATRIWIGWSNTEWTKALQKRVKGSDIQYENILNIYKGAIARLDDPTHATQLVDRLALTTANVISKSLSDGTQTIARSMAMVHLHLLAGVRIKASNMSAADVARWAIAQAQEQGVKLDTHPRTTKSNAYREARSAINQHRLDKHLFAYELDIARLENEGRIAPGSIKGIGFPGIAAAQKWLGSSAPQEFKLGIVTALLQMLALNFAMKDLANNDQFNEEETRVKAITAMVSLGATIVETVAVSVEKSVEHPLGAFIRRQWAYPQKIAGKIALAARAMGMFAGMFTAGYDIFVNAWNALERKEKILGLLYLANGLCSTGIAFAAFLSAGALFWPLLVASFLLGISIAFVNNSGLKNWIAYCEFSIGEKYKSFEEQMRIYGQVVGA